MKEVIESNDRCFSLAKFFNIKSNNISIGTLKGNNERAFPAIMYLKGE